MVNLNSIVTSDSDNTGIERCFTESMDEALKYLALQQPRAAEPEVRERQTVSQTRIMNTYRAIFDANSL